MKGLFLIVILAVLCACESQQIPPTLNPTPTLTPTPIGGAVIIPTPGLTPEQPSIRTLTIWWPDRLSPLDNTTTDALINRHIEGFLTSEENLQIEFRLKRAQDVGGIMSTLRSAREVAPGSMPDITLMRREDVVTAVESGLLQPLEGRISSAVIGDLYSTALQLGSVDNQLYGLPYTLDVLMVTHKGGANLEWSFPAFLERDQTLAFAASRSVGVSDVFLLQYLSAGGELPNDEGLMTLNIEALETTLQFYEDALEKGLIDATVLNYAASADYEALLIDGSLDAGTMQSSRYALLNSPERRFNFGTVPTLDGEPLTVLNGWMWVMVTSNPDQQAIASRFINWMMDTDRQGEYTQAVEMLPSQRTTLRLFPFAGLQAGVANNLLTNAILPLQSTSSSAAVTRVMHNALVAVLRGEMSAEAAAREAVNQLSG